MSFRQFKQTYQQLIKKIYTPQQVENTFKARFNLLSLINLWFFGGQKFYLVNKQACALLYIYEQNAYLGFLEGETEKDYQEIILEAIMLAKQQKVRSLYASVEFSIWFSHRLFKSDSNSQKLVGGNFYSEPANQAFYSSILYKLGFEVAGSYFTFSRQKFDYITKAVEPKLAKITQNFHLKNLQINLFNLHYFYQIYQLSSLAFGDHKGFAKPDFGCFLWNNLSSSSKQTDKILLGLFDGNELIGFCYNFVQNGNFFAKTVAIEAKYQNQGLTNLFVHQTHFLAQTCPKIYYVAVKEDNKVDNMDKIGTELEGEYLLFKLNLGEINNN